MKQTLAMICSLAIGYGTILQPLHTLDTFSAKSMFANDKRKQWIFWIKITSRIRLQAMWALIFFVSVIIEKGFTSDIYTIKLGRFKGLGSCKGIILGITGTKGVCTWITTDPALSAGEKWRLAPLFCLPLFLSSCSTESVVDYFLFNFEGGGGGGSPPHVTVEKLKPRRI